MLVLGIDPGYRATGIAILHMERGISPTPELITTIHARLPDRISIIHETANQVANIAKQYHPNLIAIEDFIEFRNNNGKRKLNREGYDTVRAIAAIEVFVINLAPIIEINPGSWPAKLTGQPNNQYREYKNLMNDLNQNMNKIYEELITEIIRLRLKMSKEEMNRIKKHEVDALGIALVAGDHAILNKRFC